MRLHDLVWSGLAATIAGLDLEEIVSAAPGPVKAEQVLDQLAARSGAAALAEYGIQPRRSHNAVWAAASLPPPGRECSRATGSLPQAIASTGIQAGNARPGA